MNRVENLAVEFLEHEKNGELDYTLAEGRERLAISCDNADLGAKLVSAGVNAAFITPDEGATILQALAQPADCKDSGWASDATDAEVLAANQGLNTVGDFLSMRGILADDDDDF